MRRIAGYFLPVWKSGGRTMNAVTAVPSLLLTLTCSVDPTFTCVRNAWFCFDSGRSVVPCSANTSAGSSGVLLRTAIRSPFPRSKSEIVRAPVRTRSTLPVDAWTFARWTEPSSSRVQ